MSNVKRFDVSVDSRTIKTGDVFVCVQGGKVDGNDFALDALNKGASFVVTSREDLRGHVGCLYHENPEEWLLEQGREVRFGTRAKIIAITGSVGKTTTKAWLGEVLSKYFKTTYSNKNFNTSIGLPIELLGLDDAAGVGIFELGTNSFGEISKLSRYLNPDIAVITNIKDAHIGQYDGLSQLEDEKISILEGLSDDGILIYNADSVPEYKIPNGHKIISFGIENNSNIKATHYESRNGDTAIYLNNGLKYSINAIGKQFVYTSLSIIAVAKALGLEINENLLNGFELLSPISGRGEIIKISSYGKSFEIIDDSYNASPASMASAIETLNGIAHGRRKVCVIGEMGELGEASETYHKELFSKIKLSNVSKMFFVGNSNLRNVAREFLTSSEVFEKMDEIAVEKVLKFIENDDVILIKGSNASKVYKLTERLKLLNVL